MELTKHDVRAQSTQLWNLSNHRQQCQLKMAAAGGAENDLAQLVQAAIRNAIYPLQQLIDQLESQQ
jgi:hypothetical protein